MKNLKPVVSTYLLFLSVFSLTFIDTVTSRFALFDDYYAWPWNILTRTCEGHPLTNYVGLVQGRPLGAAIVCLSNILMPDLNSAGWLRFVEIALLSALATCFSRWLLRAGIERITGLFLSVAIFTMPTFIANISYVNNMIILISGLLAGLASLPLLAAFELKSHRKITFWKDLCLAIALLLTALSINQSPAMMIWVPLLIMVAFDRRRPWQEQRKLLAKCILTVIPVMGLYMLFCRLFLLPPGDESQIVISLNPTAKIFWFYNDVLMGVANMWKVFFPSPWLLYFLTAFIAGGFALSILRTREIQRTLTMIVLFLFSFAPYLVADRDSAFYRSYVSLAPAFFVLVFWSLQQYLAYWAAERKNFAVKVAVGIWAVVAVAAGNQFLSKYIIGPEVAQLTYMKMHLRKNGIAPGSTVYILTSYKPHSILGLNTIHPTKRLWDYIEFAADYGVFPCYEPPRFVAALVDMGIKIEKFEELREHKGFNYNINDFNLRIIRDDERLQISPKPGDTVIDMTDLAYLF